MIELALRDHFFPKQHPKSDSRFEVSCWSFQYFPQLESREIIPIFQYVNKNRIHTPVRWLRSHHLSLRHSHSGLNETWANMACRGNFAWKWPSWLPWEGFHQRLRFRNQNWWKMSLTLLLVNFHIFSFPVKGIQAQMDLWKWKGDACTAHVCLEIMRETMDSQINGKALMARAKHINTLVWYEDMYSWYMSKSTQTPRRPQCKAKPF